MRGVRGSGEERPFGPLYEKLERAEEVVAADRRALGLNPRDRPSPERLRDLTG